MKIWEQLLKENEYMIDARFFAPEDITDEELYSEVPLLLKYEHLVCIIEYMSETHDEYEGPYAIESIQQHFYDKWNLYYKPYLEDDPSQIDIMIECAIDNNINPEYITFLINKKYEMNVFKEKDWRL